MSLDDIHYLDPFNQIADLSIEVIEEEYTIRRYSRLGANWYGIQLKSPPAYKNLTSESKRIIAIKSDDPGYEYTEVSFTSAPSTSQYRVDYDNRNPSDGSVLGDYTTTGLIQFNATEEGQLVEISYWSTGLGVLGTNLAAFLADEVIPGDLGITGNLAVAGASYPWDGVISDAVDVGGTGALATQGTDGLHVALNCYRAIGAWRYKENGRASLITQNGVSGLVHHRYAPPGNAGDVIPWTETQGWHVEGDITTTTGNLKDSAGTPIYGSLNDGTPLFLKKIDIGDWDMINFASVSGISAGISYSKMHNIWAIIRDDLDIFRNPIVVSSTDGFNSTLSAITWRTTGITLTREDGGSFDSGNHNATSYNRGWIYILYEA